MKKRNNSKTTEKEKPSKYKQRIAKIKHYLTRVREKIESKIVWVLQLIVNVEIDFLFVFALTYLFNYSYPWYWRLLGSYGFYQCYKIFIKNLKSLIGSTIKR